jgi:hypothetical protein
MKPSGSPTKTDWVDTWELIKAVLFLGALGVGICWGLYAGAIWVKEQFETPASVAVKAAKCYDDAEKHPWRMKECDELSNRVDVLTKRETAEKSCKDKGLKFKGTIGDQVECEP